MGQVDALNIAAMEIAAAYLKNKNFDEWEILRRHGVISMTTGEKKYLDAIVDSYCSK